MWRGSVRSDLAASSLFSPTSLVILFAGSATLLLSSCWYYQMLLLVSFLLLIRPVTTPPIEILTPIKRPGALFILLILSSNRKLFTDIIIWLSIYTYVGGGDGRSKRDSWDDQGLHQDRHLRQETLQKFQNWRQQEWTWHDQTRSSLHQARLHLRPPRLSFSPVLESTHLPFPFSNSSFLFIYVYYYDH